MWRQVFYAAVIVGVIGAGIAFGLRFTPEMRAVEVGVDAPDFGSIDVRTGDSTSFGVYQGDVVLVNIWATWCAPCKVEMPSMQALYDSYKDRGFRIAAVSVDVLGSDDVLAFADDLDLTFDILQDRAGHINRQYQVTGYPESFLVDRHGVIVKKVIGPTDWNSSANRSLVESLLDDERT